MKQSDVKKLTEALESFCKDHGARFTPPRRITLEIIANNKRPIGAYDVIEEMGRITDKPKPTTVYRALEFLQAHGFIHKIDGQNNTSVKNSIPITTLLQALFTR